jgi:hypothetical protein
VLLHLCIVDVDIWRWAFANKPRRCWMCTGSNPRAYSWGHLIVYLGTPAERDPAYVRRINQTAQHHTKQSINVSKILKIQYNQLTINYANNLSKQKNNNNATTACASNPKRTVTLRLVQLQSHLAQARDEPISVILLLAQLAESKIDQIVIPLRKGPLFLG